MLKKKDLVKEFELVVQQEITNHNNAILASNSSINNIQEKLDLKTKHDNCIHASLNASISQTNIAIKQLSEQLLQLAKQVKANMADVNQQKECEHAERKQLLLALDALVKKNQKLSDQVSALSEKAAMLENWVARVEKNMVVESDNMCLHLTRGLAKLKSEILERPSEIECFKKEIDRRFSDRETDIKCLLQQLEDLKRDCFYKEKKLENIYTLIERFNKKLAA